MPSAMLSPSASRSLASRRAASLSGRGVVPAAASRARAAPRPARASPGATRAEFSVGKLASVLAKKTQGDLDRVFKGTSKTRERLGYMDEVLALWRLDDLEDTLEELEETLLSVDFGPATSARVLDAIRERVEGGEISTGAEVKAALKTAIVDILERANGGNAGTAPLLLAEQSPSVVLVVGVNGGGKTTTVGKLSHRFAKESGAKVMLVPGDTFRAAAAEQLATWAERSDGIMATYKEGTKPGALCYQAVDEAVKLGDVDIVLADTSGRLHTNCDLMDELAGVKRSIGKRLEGAPHETMLVLDGTTGLNMLNQAREFHETVQVTGLILTKLDGTARGGAVVSVVDELGVPVKFVGVGEGMEDLQTFEPRSFVDALFPEDN
jgi:fused signal recognition particle receptor